MRGCAEADEIHSTVARRRDHRTSGFQRSKSRFETERRGNIYTCEYYSVETEGERGIGAVRQALAERVACLLDAQNFSIHVLRRAGPGIQ